MTTEEPTPKHIDSGTGIDLALDPNLITLALNSNSNSNIHSPSSDEPIPGSAEKVGTNAHLEGDELESSTKKDNDKRLKFLKSKDSLVSNPHEIYGSMPLEQLIPIILRQRGPGFKFVDLNEKELQNEINQRDNNNKNINDDSSYSNQEKDGNAADEGEQVGEDFMEVDYEDKNDSVNPQNETEHQANENGETDDDVETVMTQEQFVKRRREMVEHINLAMNESSLALEFVSLLLSSVKESTGMSSMSPFLRKVVKPSSLNSDKIPYEAPTKKEYIELDVLNKGWKLQSLNESKDLLRESFNKLVSILQHEHDYWNKIMQNISNKDVIFKIRDRSSGQKLLAIKYGYEDSGSTYRHDRGIANIRNNVESQNLDLIPHSSSVVKATNFLHSVKKFLRVRIFTKIESEDDYILSGESITDGDGENNETELKDIRKQIQVLKKIIFEKELMYQIKKECVLLISYGVSIENENKVIIELPNEKFEIELLSLDDDSIVNHEQDLPKINDKRANLMLVMLRLLLVVIFKKTLRSRIGSPRRMTNLKVDDDILLIRPILGKIRFANYKLLLKKIIKDYVLDIIPGSSITETEVKREEFQENENIDDENITRLNSEIRAFDKLLNVPKRELKINLSPSDHKNPNLSLTLESPNYCNALIHIKFEDTSEANTVSFDTTFSDFKEVEDFLHFIVAEFIQYKKV
ncbi:srb4p [Saccharomyces arboricola H-6]|uniref:Mediator of RNA polymerase II transcription subunit 17 n=1 Tax=Saccharomyces arboricola (strain H-6 / AS 2.3317 / CBS 10644) TaxID=1160507 RepID=J8PPH6_SACAR|nr:srb4p [Saccharomyces arboricola H-6]